MEEFSQLSCKFQHPSLSQATESVLCAAISPTEEKFLLIHVMFFCQYEKEYQMRQNVASSSTGIQVI